MRSKDLHMKLLKRLVPAWLLVSAVIGAIVYFFELEKIDGLAIGTDGTLRSVIQAVMVVLVTTIILYPIIISLNRELLRRSRELYQADLGMIEILGNAMAKRDSDTNTHNYRVTIYAIRLAEAVGGFTREAMQGLIKGAFLHDLGKIAISDTILLKPDLLTPEETTIMRTHVEHGIDIIRDYHWLADALDVVSYHHEQFDGKGFKGVQGEEIPLNARIFAICDVFDALTSKRPYKKPVSFDESFQMIQQLRGTHLDPALVETFNSIAEGLYAKVSKADEDSLKIMLKQHVDRYFGAQTAVPRGQGTGAAS